MMRTDVDDYPGTPRWVKVSGIILVVLVLILVAILLFTGGEHGPGRHSLQALASFDTMGAGPGR